MSECSGNLKIGRLRRSNIFKTVAINRVHSQSNVFGHPAGLAILFASEMWERFSFYGMRALLILFMTQTLLLGDTHAIAGLAGLQHLLERVTGPMSASGLASQVYGLYSGLVYLTPLLGGALADRVFGRRPMIIVGGLLMIAGHLLLTWRAGFLAALLLIILGTGCFKGNIAGQVGDLYAPTDPRRERGFSIFYVGINVGATAAPLVCAWLALAYGWSAAFAATRIGMVVGLAVYLAGQRFLPSVPPVSHSVGRSLAPSREAEEGHGWVLLGIGLCAVSVWISYEQQANAMVRWVSAATGGHGVALSWLQSIPPATVILGTPILTRLWAHQAVRGAEPSPTRKLTIGAALIAISQLILAGLATLPAAWMSRSSWLLPACLCGYMGLWEMGDLYLSPAAMAIFSRLAPRGRVSTAMAGWYLTVFVGSLISGWIGSFWGVIAPAPYWAAIAGLSLASVAGFALIERRVSMHSMILLSPAAAAG